jgi:hypothetical protein
MLHMGYGFTEVWILHKPYIPDLPTYLVFYFETTRGSSIDPPMTDVANNNNDNDNTL